MQPFSIALMIYGEPDSGRNALTEEKYQDLARAFLAAGFRVQSVLYHDALADALNKELLRFDAVLVWVNPIEQGKDRRKLDALLTQAADQGCLVSAHPEVILKMGTKQVLYSTKMLGWAGKTHIYTHYDEFFQHFPQALQESGIKVLKQYRGNGGNGVYKIMKGPSDQEVIVIHAKSSQVVNTYSWEDFYREFESYLFNDGMLIEQEWNEHLVNGIVRCYLTGNKVVGFGYQEINALYEAPATGGQTFLPPSKRYYFTQHCGLFSDLKQIMESTWVRQLQQQLAIADEKMPVIWDADFFINHPHSPTAAGKYTLCEINVSSVSPFPPSAVPFIVEEVSIRLQAKKGNEAYEK